MHKHRGHISLMRLFSEEKMLYRACKCTAAYKSLPPAPSATARLLPGLDDAVVAGGEQDPVREVHAGHVRDAVLVAQRRRPVQPAVLLLRALPIDQQHHLSFMSRVCGLKWLQACHACRPTLSMQKGNEHRAWLRRRDSDRGSLKHA